MAACAVGCTTVPPNTSSQSVAVDDTELDPGVASGSSPSPPLAASAFRAAYMTITHGLPNDGARKVLAPFITKDLDRLLVAASIAESMRPVAQRFTGDPFTATGGIPGTIDLGQSCTWGSADKIGVCSPRFANAGGSWEDKWLAFEVDDNKWLLGDVIFDVGKNAQVRPRLSELMKSIISK